jgi:hypothetical protein
MTLKNTVTFLFMISLVLFLTDAVRSEIVVLYDAHGNPYRLEQYITTHYTKSGGDDKIGGEREWGYYNAYYGKNADLRWMNLDKDGHPWDDTIKPSYNNYHNEITAYNEIQVKQILYGGGNIITVNDDNGNGIADQIELYEYNVFNRTGVHCDILNYNPLVPLQSYLLQNHPNMQIINNFQYGNSLFTIFFPPYWKMSDAYPIVLTGLGYGFDNNYMYLTGSMATGLAVNVANSVDNGGAGLMAVQSNCGGREALGISEDALDDVGSFMQNVVAQYGGDINRVVTKGASRAGNTALVWGANPNADIYHYNTLAIHSYVPPVKIGSMITLSRATFPSLQEVLNTILGSDYAYRHDYVDEDSGTVMTPQEKSGAALSVILGTTSPEEADNLSAYGRFSDPLLIPSLRQKRILIAQGTHDSFMPMPYFLDFDNALTSNQINHRTFIGYLFSHNYIENEGDEWNTLYKLVSGEEILPFDSSTRVFYMPASLANDGNGTKVVGSVRISDDIISAINIIRPGYFNPDHDETKLGFSASLPCRVGQGLPLTITLIGENGKSWNIWTRKENGYKSLYSQEGIFGQSINSPDELEYGDEWVILHLPANYPANQRYEWFFEYDGKEIPNRFTPFVSPSGVLAKAVTEITSSEPLINDYWHEYRYDHINFGVDQYHPVLFQGNSAPIVGFIPNLVMREGEQVAVTVTAVDPDNDQVVFDLRDSNNNIVSFADGNGLTGEFTLNPTVGMEGSYQLKVIAKDGVGGVGERVFSLTVTGQGPPPNTPPTADAGPDQTLTDVDADGSESVILDGSGSFDSDGVIVAYEWKEGETVLGNTVSITDSFAVGSHTVTLTVTDDEGATGSDDVIVTVNPNTVPCDSLASLTVTTDQRTFVAGDIVTGDIVFTNNTGAPLHIDATGNIYDETMTLVLTKSVSGTIPEGVNTYNLSDVFGTLYIDPSVPIGDYAIEVSITAPSEACTWVDTAIVTVATTR